MSRVRTITRFASRVEGELLQAFADWDSLQSQIDQAPFDCFDPDQEVESLNSGAVADLVGKKAFELV